MNPFGGSLNPSAQPFNPTGFAAAAPTSAFAQPAFGGFGGAAPASFGAAPAACGGNPFGGGGAFDGAPAVAADGVFGARGAVFGGAAAVAPRAFGAIFGGAPGGAGAFGGGATTPFGGRQTQQAPAAVFGSSAGVGTFGGGGSAGSSTFGGGGSSGTSMFGRPSGGSTFGGGAASGGSAFGGGSSGSSAFGGGAASRGSAFGGGAASGSCAFGGSSSGGGALGGGASSSGSGFGGGAASGSSMFGGGDKAALGGSMFDGGSSGGGAFGGGSGGGGKRAGPSAFGGTVAASKGTSFGCPPERPPFGGAPRGRSRSPPADQQPFGARAWPPSIPADQPYGGGPRGGDRGGGGNSGSKRVSFQPAAGGAAVGAPAAAASTDKMWVRQPAAPRAAHRELGPHEAPREAAAATPGGAFDRRDKSRRPAAAAGAAASVRVSRLPAHVDEAALQRAFEVYGPVRSAKVMTTAGGAPRGMGFVNFRDAKHAAAAAQAADGTDVFGCQKPVGCALQQPRAGESDGPPGQTQPPAGYAQAQKPPQQSSASETYSVKIQPLPVTFKQEDLASLLKKATSVRVIAGKGGTPGYGYANFDHRSDAQAAARQLTGADIGAGPIHASVKVAPAQQPSSRRPQPPTAQKPAAYDVDVDDEGDRLDDDDDEPDDEAVDDDDDGAADGAADGQSLPPPHALFRGSLGGNDDRDMNSERASRFALSAVRERSLSPPPSAQPVVKTDGAMLIGECSQMCPQVEIDERCRFKELDEFERPPGYAGMDDAALRLAARAFAVKKYKRSDAGSVQNVPDLVRPPVTLVVTFDHLVKHVVETPAKSTLEAYLFLWDRFRCIRKDFIMQNYTTGGIADAEVARVFEGMARYFIATEQALRLQPEWFEGPAHGKHNAESLSETLSALLAFYAMSFERSGGDEGALTGLDTEAEMTAYWLIFFLDNEGGAEAGRLLTTLAQTRPKLHAHAAVRRADDVRVARNDGNFAKFFQLISTSPYLVRCLALSLYEARTRDAALKLMRLAYGKREPYARADVARVLAYESEATLVADLDRVGCVIHGDDVYFDAPLDGGAASRQAAVDARRAGAVAAPFYAAAPAPLGRELAAVVGGCDKATREAQVAAVESQRRLQAAAAAAAAALRLRQYVEAQARKRADDEREAQLAAAAQQLAADEAQRSWRRRSRRAPTL
ncbi:SAC3/GANP/Nin1/mts3/eIF-3 p25 family-domain-containing protein [Pelagophyceae sp. CCMP2097]|nr:SAC3/GANP/Nin1/mts3/eIF-3 p25 family-domain-containing protein [Pelagophyceae sp. CCMP2097]